LHEIEALKADIDHGLADVAARRVKGFDKKKLSSAGESY
jgi:hypothetical protein